MCSALPIRFEVRFLVPKTYHRRHIAYVDVIVVKRNPKGTRQLIREQHLLWSTTSLFLIVQHYHLARSHIRQENIPVRRHDHKSRPSEVGGIYAHLKTIRRFGQKASRRLGVVRSIARALGGKWWRQIRFLTVGYLRKCGYSRQKCAAQHHRSPQSAFDHALPHDAPNILHVHSPESAQTDQRSTRSVSHLYSCAALSVTGLPPLPGSRACPVPFSRSANNQFKLSYA